MSKKANKNTSAKPANKATEALKKAVTGSIEAGKNTPVIEISANPKPAAPAAPEAAPAVKPLVDLSKISTKGLRIALNQETAMKPSVAMAYRDELAKREAAQPASKPAAKSAEKPDSKPAAPKADSLELHLNNTGRLCFGRHAAARLTEAGFPIDAEYFMTMAIDKGTVRLEPTSKALDGALTVRDGGGRPYISATKQFKQHGFAASAGGAAYSIEAKPYGKAGFEFRLPKMA